MVIKLIAGIGNFNYKYSNTRHNLGHTFIQALAKKYNIYLQYDKFICGLVGSIQFDNFTLKLLIPNSYVNNSGIVISKYVHSCQLSLQELLIVHDELDLKPGIIKIKLGKKNRTSHHGIQSIINEFNNNFNFYRLRIGIGRPQDKNKIKDFVLSTPSIEEKKKINSIIYQTICHIEDLICNHCINFISKFHSK